MAGTYARGEKSPATQRRCLLPGTRAVMGDKNNSEKNTETVPILRYWFYGHDFTISPDAFQYAVVYGPGTSSALVFAHKTHARAPFPSVLNAEIGRNANIVI